MLALIAALRQEMDPCLKVLDLQEVITWNQTRMVRAGTHRTEMLLVHGGMGDHVVAAADLATRHFPVTAIVSFGCAGGASPVALGGHVVVATQVVLAAGQEKPIPTDPELTGRLLESGKSGGAVCHSGPMVTVDKVIATPREKAFIGATHRALALDMESYWLGKFAQERKLPFAVARSIFDPVEMPVVLPPDLAAHPWSLWKYPGLWSSLPKLARQQRLVARGLQQIALGL